MDAARQCVARCRDQIDACGAHIAQSTARNGRIDSAALNARQPEVFGMAHHLARITAAEAVLDWAANHGELEQGIAETFVALSAAEMAGWIGPRTAALGLSPTEPDPDGFIAKTLRTEHLTKVGAQVLRSGTGASGLDETHLAIKDAFDRFTQAEIAPVAEQIHREDLLLPETLLSQLVDLGVFGISIPEDYGGSYIDHTTMIVATESLSRGSLGAGGSVITRPEICAKALMAGGTEAQKQTWLPAIAAGQRMVSVAVTEPDAGSDVSAMRTTATRVPGGYRLNGEKTWCTFAGRADTLLLLARTGEAGHRGLSLFLVDKPATRAGQGSDVQFEHTDTQGGRISGQAIRTVGYRGMHSFCVQLDDWFVAEDHRIGAEGQGFYLMMHGFAGGRIQTAARAIGVMSAALSEARAYATEREVFGGTLGDLSLTQAKMAEMAARLQASRQLALAVGQKMDSGGGALEAALVKLMSCKEAEWVTREAMQLHGGMGYAEEYAVSRYWQDARVLSIFEGAEEVLAIRVIARGFLRTFLTPAEKSA